MGPVKNSRNFPLYLNSTMGKQFLSFMLLIGSFAVEILIGYALWTVPQFLNGERIHDKLMAIGDAREAIRSCGN